MGCDGLRQAASLMTGRGSGDNSANTIARVHRGTLADPASAFRQTLHTDRLALPVRAILICSPAPAFREWPASSEPPYSQASVNGRWTGTPAGLGTTTTLTSINYFSDTFWANDRGLTGG